MKENQSRYPFRTLGRFAIPLTALLLAVTAMLAACDNSEKPDGVQTDAATTTQAVTTTTLEETTPEPEETTTVSEDTTTVPEETTTAEPEVTTTAPEVITTAEPETTTAAPEVTTTPEPETTTAAPEGDEGYMVDFSAMSGQPAYQPEFAAAGYHSPLFLLGYGDYIDLGYMDLSKYDKVFVQYGCDGGSGTENNFAALGGNVPIGLKSAASTYGQDGSYNMDDDLAHATLFFNPNSWASGARWVEIDLTDVDYAGNVYVALHNPAGTQIAVSAIEFIWADEPVTTEPEVTTTEPETTTAEPEVTTTEPEVTTTEPEVTTTEPEVTTTEPEVTTTEPEVTTTEPEIEITEPTVLVNRVTASAGGTVNVTVAIKNNPGISGARFYVSYDSGLTLQEAESGDAFAMLDYTAPRSFFNACPFNWDSLDAVSDVDGTILTLTFEVAGDVAPGSVLNVSVSYSGGDVYDFDLNDVALDVINGTITIA